MKSNNNIKIIFLIFSFFIFKSVENKIVPRRLEYREMEGTDGTNSTYYEERIKPKPTLLGFGNYIEEKNEKKISFNVFIKKIADGPVYKYIFFTLKIFLKNLRGLSEDYVEKKVKGILDTQYDLYCSYIVDIDTDNDDSENNINIDSIDTINFKNDFHLSENENEKEEDKDDIPNEEDLVTVNLGGQMNNINIKEETNTIKNAAIFQFQELNIKNEYEYELYGIISFINNKYVIKNSAIEINYIQDYYYEIMKSTLERIEGDKYCIKFKIKNTINTNLDGAWANVTSLLCSKNLDTDDMILYLSENNMYDLSISKEYAEEKKIYFHNKKNSSGLSGGAIAGIVIGCIVVLVALSIAFIFLRKVEKQPQLQSSAIDFYNYNSTAQINADP